MPNNKRLPLPVVDHSRSEFGLPRTVCACIECVANCRFLPGYLIPADLDRIMPPRVDPFTWATENLRASPGATVGDLETARVWRIPTLVPARSEKGKCIYLDENRCRIHAVAPFGCAFFDHRSSGRALSLRGLRAVDQAHREPESLYHRLWVFLHNAGLIAPGPEESRRQLRRYLEAQQPWWKRRSRRRK